MRTEKEIREEFASIEESISEIKELMPELCFIRSLEFQANKLVRLLERRRELCKELDSSGVYDETN